MNVCFDNERIAIVWFQKQTRSQAVRFGGQNIF